jgi:hypothetical protein
MLDAQSQIEAGNLTADLFNGPGTTLLHLVNRYRYHYYHYYRHHYYHY